MQQDTDFEKFESQIRDWNKQLADEPEADRYEELKAQCLALESELNEFKTTPRDKQGVLRANLEKGFRDMEAAFNARNGYDQGYRTAPDVDDVNYDPVTTGSAFETDAQPEEEFNPEIQHGSQRNPSTVHHTGHR